MRFADRTAISLWILLSGGTTGELLSEPPPVLTPDQQLQTFQFAEPGYRIELVASDPMVQDPVAMTFDGQGRLWVVEMRGYMRDIDRSDVKKPDGRVSVLEDTDGDGRMDRSTVFADDLVLPRAILVYPDGVLIAENEPLSFFEDLDGDLRYDRKTAVDPKYARDSIEHSANGLLRGLDNWIYNAKEGHRYRREGQSWLREVTEPRGQWGICQDDWGRLFYNYNHSQLHGDFVPPNTLTRNPNHEPSTGLSIGITTNNQVFPIRPTLAANRGYIPGALDEQGRIKEFTSACAPLIYRGNLFPEFAGNSFVCETVGNLIKRSVLTETGVRVTAASAYPDRDFLASTDERFRPCWLTLGPNGAIYIADMYRGIVQDGPHMSPYLREHSIEREMDKPIHLGRIWRIAPDGFSQPEVPDFADRSEDELVALLAHPSGWWRDRAQMHLVDTEKSEAIPALTQMLRTHESPIARLHALWTLEGLGFSEAELLLTTLRTESSAKVKAALLRVLAGRTPESEIRELIKCELELEIALQLLVTVEQLELPAATRFSVLERILLPQVADPLMRDAAMSSLTGEEARFLHFIWPRLDADEAPPGQAFLVEALSAAAAKPQDEDILASLQVLADSETPAWKKQALTTGIALHVRPPVDDPNVRPLKDEEQKSFVRGRQVYLTSCVACHGMDGRGMKLLAPPLAGSDWVEGSEERLVRVLFHGLSGPITVSGKRYSAPDVQPLMPPLANLNNADIAAVLTYIRREWGNRADPISRGEVNQHRIKAQGRTTPWTEAELEPFANPK